MSVALRRSISLHQWLPSRWFSVSSAKLSEDDIVHFPDKPCVTIPVYKPPANESIDQQRARLTYQSRKRGMLENDLLLSTFAGKYLKAMTKTQLDTYDKLINDTSNEWNLYYWITEKDPTPKEYDNEIMDMLKDHVNNNDRDLRSRQPDLY